MYVRPISERLFRGRLTPAILAMRALSLPLLVTLVLADDQHHSVAADDLALLAHRLYRRSYLHDPFRRLGSGDPALAAVVAAATWSWRCSHARKLPRIRAGLRMVATPGSTRTRRTLRNRLHRAGVGGEAPGRWDPRSRAGDRNGELEVRGLRAILGEDRPAVPPHAHRGTTGGGHRLDQV